jgi:endonuclease/exonuclease/phosphatase family metal-dependent hydrolase
MNHMQIAITTLNLQGYIDWQNREQNILTYLEQTRPDLIFFQEVTFLPEIEAYNQVGLLNQTLKYPFEHSDVTRLQKSSQYDTYREGLGMLSKLPIVKTETIVLKQDPSDEHQRIVQLIDIKKGDEIIKLANIHFAISDFTEAWPQANLQEVLDILRSRGETRIICGDFNMNDLNVHADMWQDEYVASTSIPYITYPEEQKRIDYFLLPKEFSFESIATSPDGLSDHRALSIIAKKPLFAGIDKKKYTKPYHDALRIVANALQSHHD